MPKYIHIFILLILITSYFAGCISQGKQAAEGLGLSQSTSDACRDSINKDPAKAIKMIDSLKNTINDSVGFYQLSHFLVIAYYYTNQTDSALLLNKQIIDFTEKQPPSMPILRLAISSYNNRGVLLQHHNLKDSAILCLQKLYQLLDTTETVKNQLLDVCQNLAEAYYQNGKYPQASFYYRRALTLADSLNDESAYFPVFSGMARLYQEIENQELAEEFFLKAEKYWDKSEPNERIFFANCRGLFCTARKEYDDAIAWFHRADSFITPSSPHIDRIITYGNTGEAFLLKEEKDSARHYLDKAQSYMDASFRQLSIEFYINALYAALALLENDLATAEKHLTRPYDMPAINPQYIYYHNKRMYELYLKKGDYRKASQYLRRATEYNDSLRNVKIYNNIAEIDSRYRQDTILIRKDAQIDIAKAKAEHWQGIAFLNIALSAVLVALIAGIILYLRKVREVRYQQQVAMITGLRMEIVRNRISPHFMFNALNTIMPTLDNYKELEQPFRLLIQLLRSNLQASEQIAIPLEKEIELVKYYLQLCSIRSAESPHIEWQISGQVQTEVNVPSMSIQIPVENAIKYAFGNESKDSFIYIRIDLVEGKNVLIAIRDNGKGYAPTQHANDERGTGNGLKMLYRTFDILNAKNEEKIQFRIENIQQLDPHLQGTLVTLSIPLNYNFKL